MRQDERKDCLDAVKARLRVRVPGLKKSVGAGDVIRKVTDVLGLEPCDDCEVRRKRLNRLLRFDSYLEE